MLIMDNAWISTKILILYGDITKKLVRIIKIRIKVNI